ncbi:unnamed protein product [Acanthoscelides obtectus]|uniref:DUF7064 domain-containing protein n=1 Tax=Acanthoscelides obtectus TaxID=200917 RepID=A0A9P0KVH1_ACAOB|nr:unnamed protein product [Acanthoscelides obtectus]CAK1675144.1 hypothetical protein AOBTE_LOCUS29937 [Acanthoscelides obtectus]
MFGIAETTVITCSVLLLFVWRLLEESYPPICGIYQRKNGLYWLKVLFMYTALSLRKAYGTSNEDILYAVKIDAIWISDLPYFNFDTDMDPLRLASDMAYEPWSKSYFDTLQKVHQTHYEQFGTLRAKATIGGKVFDFKLDTLRDHSFGEFREWRTFKRYGCHWFTTADGDHFNISKICCPISFSRLTVGYVYSKKQRKLYPVTECDLELYQHGAFGNPPKDYAFTAKAGGETYAVQVNVKDTPQFFISKDWEAKILENLCTVTVNGVKGWGAAEWQYRNIQGKCIHY